MARALLPLQDFDLQKATWREAAIVCTDRNSVMEFNRIRAQLFAMACNEPIIHWRIPLPATQDSYFFLDCKSSFPTHHRVNAHLRVGTQDRISPIIQQIPVP